MKDATVHRLNALASVVGAASDCAVCGGHHVVEIEACNQAAQTGGPAVVPRLHCLCGVPVLQLQHHPRSA